MSHMIVYTYGMAEFTSMVFNAVVVTVNNTGYSAALKGMFLVYMFAATAQYIATKNVAIIAKNL
nr:hypothetical protein [Rickettsiaceae bacterium]